MTTASINTIVNFEICVLMMTKLRLKIWRKEAALAAKLSQHGFPSDDAERIYRQMSGALEEESTRFATMKELLSAADQGASVLTYNSVLWPGFDFTAIADNRRLLKSAAYSHNSRDSTIVRPPSWLSGVWTWLSPRSISTRCGKAANAPCLTNFFPHMRNTNSRGMGRLRRGIQLGAAHVFVKIVA